MSLLKLDRVRVLQFMKWRPATGDFDPEHPVGYPKYTGNNFGIYAGGDFSDVPEDKLELGINARVHIPLDCTLDPKKYHVQIAPNPKLYEVAEVSCPLLLIPDSGLIRPIVRLRGLVKFDLSSLDWIATIHLI